MCTLGVFSPKKKRSFETSSKIFLHSDTYSRVVASMSECRTMDDVAVSPTKSHTLQISCRNLSTFGWTFWTILKKATCGHSDIWSIDLMILCDNIFEQKWLINRLVFFQNAVFALGANPLDSCLPCKICASP